MKKVLMLVAVAGVFTLTSCKKDWTCKCTTTVGGISTSASSTITGKKSDAKLACELGTYTLGSTSVSCVIE